MKTIKFFLIVSLIYLFTNSFIYGAHICTNIMNSTTSFSPSITSELIGIWQNNENPKYYYEFKVNGEFVRYKLKEKNRGGKIFGTYTVNGNFLYISFAGNETEHSEFHIDNNIMVIYDKEEGNKIVMHRVSKSEFDKRTQNFEWYY